MTTTVVLVMGVSAVGKTTLGTALSRALGAPLVEADSFHSIANIEKMKLGIPLTDEDRMPWLDQIRDEIEELSRSHSLVVCACSALKRSYRDRLRHVTNVHFVLICLVASRETLLKRLHVRKGHFMPSSLLEDQLHTLESPVSDENAVTLTSETDPQTLLDQTLEMLKVRGIGT